MPGRTLRAAADAPYRSLVGVGGVGTGVFFALEGDHDLGRNESRPARLLNVRDYCKLHIIAHYPALLLGARPSGSPFHVLPVAKVGDDEAGRRLRVEMEAAGMDCRFVESVAGRPTLQSVCFQYPDGSGGNITTSDSAAATLTPADVERVAERIDRRTIALAAPEAPLDARLRLLEIATPAGALRVASFTPAEFAEARARGGLKRVDLLAMNADEARSLAGQPVLPEDPAPLLEACAARFRSESAGGRLVVSLGAGGAHALEGGEWEHAAALPVAVQSTAGAGDALLGGILTGLALGLPLIQAGCWRNGPAERPLASALELGVLLAAFKVTSPHTIPPELSLDALLSFARSHGVLFGAGLLRLVPERLDEAE